MKKQKEQPKEKQYTTEDFAKAYQELCDKMGYRVSVNPAYISRDDGSWSTVLQTSVKKLPKQKKREN